MHLLMDELISVVNDWQKRRRIGIATNRDEY